ncbi:BRCT domain-containing protein, partial [Melanogaster broomeanus]
LHFAPQTHMCILTPHWFDDSIRLGRRLPETPYTWPDPPILRPGAVLAIEEDPNINDGKRKRKKAVDQDVEIEEGPSPSIGGEKEKVWGGRKILLSHSLELSQGSRETIEAGIRRAGGVILAIRETGDEQDVEEKVVDECDVLVTRWRSGKAYFKAARASLLIGTLTWLFSIESRGTLHSPLDSLLWYPIPRGGIAGLVGCEISLTNYTGAARDYLKRLISLMGANFTPSMSVGNAVLVAGQPSPKSTRALSWSIPVVNHTWVEDCFVEWRSLTVGLERYVVFPPGIDFGKIPKSGSPKSLLVVAKPKSTASAEKSRGVSKPTSSRIPPPGTSTSARDVREVEEAITLDPGAESEFVMENGGLEDDQPPMTVKS